MVYRTREDYFIHLKKNVPVINGVRSYQKTWIPGKSLSQTEQELGVKMGRFVNSSYWNDRRYAPDHLSISVPNTEDILVSLSILTEVSLDRKL